MKNRFAHVQQFALRAGEGVAEPSHQGPALVVDEGNKKPWQDVMFNIETVAQHRRSLREVVIGGGNAFEGSNAANGFSSLVDARAQ